MPKNMQENESLKMNFCIFNQKQNFILKHIVIIQHELTNPRFWLNKEKFSVKIQNIL